LHQALVAARDAQERDEVPIGAASLAELNCWPSLEIARAPIAIQLRTRRSSRCAKRRRKLDNYRLTDVVVYSTIEPCAMCAGALIQARVRRLVYGSRDERAGAVESRFRICDTEFLNHRIEITAGVMEAECREIMQEFFRARRARQV